MGIYRLRTEFGHHLKKWMFGLAIIFIIGAAFSFGPGMFGDKQQQDGYSAESIATVNGTPITRAEFETSWDKMYEMAKGQGIYSPLQLAGARQQVFTQMVNNKLLLSAAKEMGVDISDNKVKEEADKYIVAYLKQNRTAVLGKLSKDQEKTDPREDNEYKNALSKNGYSISQQEEMAKSQVPTDTIQAQMAIKGIQEKIKASVKPATARDVTDSYNVYKIRQIVLMYRGPKEQIKTKADKILAEAKAGKDFAALAKANSDMPDKSTGGSAVYSFDTRMMFPQQLRDAIAKLQPGEVSPVIDTDMGVAIVKLESVAPKLPAKFDKKVQDQRRKDINNERQMVAMMEFGKKMQASQKVQVKDPELLGYWKLSEAQMSMMDPAKYQKSMKVAEGAFKKAKEVRGSSVFAIVMLAQIDQRAGKAKEAIDLLEPILEGDSATAEGADLRVMLGDLYMQQKQSDKALNQYVQASEVAQSDVNIHQQLAAKFQQLKKSDWAAKEQKTVADLQARMKAAQPAPTNAPAAPKSPKSGE